MKGRSNALLKYLEEKLKDFETATAVELTFARDHFDMIPEIENAVVFVIDKANPDTSNIQIHVSSSPVSIIADKAFFQLIAETLLAQLFDTIQSGIPISIHITQTEETGIIEIQASGLSATNSKTVFNADPSLILCSQLVEDMGGELVYLLNEKGMYFRLKFLLE